MNLDIIADKLNYHTSIIQPKKNIDVMLDKMGYAKPKQPKQFSPRQIDMLNYYTDIRTPSLAERIIAKYKKEDT